MMKIFRSKTMWLAFLVEITGILQLIQLSIDEFRVVIPPEYFGYVLVGIGIAIRVMRLLTTTSLDLKGREYDDSYQIR